MASFGNAIRGLHIFPYDKLHLLLFFQDLDNFFQSGRDCNRHKDNPHQQKYTDTKTDNTRIDISLTKGKWAHSFLPLGLNSIFFDYTVT